MDFKGRYQKLNPAQREAVDTTEGPVMVIAGPGTGKTELLSVRAANILKKTDTLPENILCLTFTESGQAAMRQRLVEIIGRDAYKIAVHTFHSFAGEVIAENRDYFYRGAAFQLADDIAAYEILHSIFKELDSGNILASTMNDDFVYLRDTQKVISELRRAGLTSDELRTVLDANDLTISVAERELAAIFEATPHMNMVPALRKAASTIRDIDDQTPLIDIVPLSRLIADSLEEALDQAEGSDKKTFLTAWRNEWMKKNEDGSFILKAHERQNKLRTVQDVYYQYLKRLETANLYDYDDLILQVAHALELKKDLRFNLQEQYLYIMVDEFQDTNMAQMRIVRSLTNNPVNEGKPNVLVVGDDDQAIYSFQGAEISNILRFQDDYPATKRIVLTNNYRSTAEILKQARNVILLGHDRLENRIENLSKELTANGIPHHNGTVSIHEATTAADERQWIVQDIARVIKTTDILPSDIAVITRKHADIEALLPYFASAGIAVQYTHSDNVFEQEPIVFLEKLARVVLALSNSQLAIADSLLPELLAHPVWSFQPEELWQLSVYAYDKRTRWFDSMALTPRFLEVHHLLLTLSTGAKRIALEPMLDLLIGKPDLTMPLLETPSPLYQYFFSETARERDPENYLLFLDGLRTLRQKLCDYQPGNALTLQSLIDFIDAHRRIKSQVQLSRTTNEHIESAVNLMTAHASKGLEFDTVYVVNATDRIWGEKARSMPRIIDYPENMPFKNAGDTSDERLRLFYVALTRARCEVHISYSVSDDSARTNLRANFLLGDNWQPLPINPPADIAAAIRLAETSWFAPLMTPTRSLKELLAPRLERYRLSVSDLNAFLDVTHGGPQSFLLDHLLRFPHAPNAHAAYGTAIHRTLQQAHDYITINHNRRPVEDVLGDFEINLRQQRLSEEDFDNFLRKGSDDLTRYFLARYDNFADTQKTEVSFYDQGVVIGDAELSGIIDLIDINKKNKTICVYDYKTGKPSRDWKGRSDYEKVKLHNYRRQLLFYKLLIDGSRSYGQYTADSGVLEYVEPTRSGEVVSLELAFTREEIDHLKALIEVVWQRIKTLDLPDISSYSVDLKGIEAFEQDILDGKS